MTDIAEQDLGPETQAVGTYIAPIWLQSLTYPAQSDRLLADTVYTQGGVAGAAALAVTQRGAGANMSVDIAAGTVVIAGTSVAGQGKYLGRLTAPVNVPITAAPSAGLTRIDLVHARVYDATAAGGTRNELTVEEVIAGTPASSNPAAAALPATSEALAWVTVASGTAAVTNAMIADKRRQATLGLATPPVFIFSGQFFPTADASGKFNIVLPTGGKLVSALAATAWSNGPWLVIWDANASPVGGNFAQFIVYTLAGVPAVGQLGVAYQITYTL